MYPNTHEHTGTHTYTRKEKYSSRENNVNTLELTSSLRVRLQGMGPGHQMWYPATGSKKEFRAEEGLAGEDLLFCLYITEHILKTRTTLDPYMRVIHRT